MKMDLDKIIDKIRNSNLDSEDVRTYARILIREFAKEYHKEQLLLHSVVVPKGTLCECNWPLIRTGTSERAEYCGKCGKDI